MSVLVLWNLAFMTCVMCARVLVSVVTLFLQLFVGHVIVITALQRFALTLLPAVRLYWET